MGSEESGEREGEEIKVSNSLPDISQHHKFVEAASSNLIFPRESLDALYTWWARSEAVDAVTERFTKAVAVEGLSELERKQATKILKERVSLITALQKGINEFAASENPKWGRAKPIIERVEDYSDELSTNEQVIALCEAIAESRDVNVSPEILRRKIAQRAWIELFRTFDYASMRFAAGIYDTPTTIDDLETEKEDISSALKRDLWGEEKIEKERKVYRGLRALIRENYSSELGEDLRLLWFCVRGKMPKRISAIDILRVQERILTQLHLEGAFEYEPE